jgi:hypothetical protein
MADFCGKVRLARLMQSSEHRISNRFRRRKMFNISMPQTITAAIGAIVLSATFLSSAVGPVHASQIAQVTTSAQAHA